jgi:hypothetical protein
MSTAFQFSPVQAADVLARMEKAPDGPVAIQGADWQQAAMAALLNAEMLAVTAGVVPAFEINGQRGVLIPDVGAAREKFANGATAAPGVRELYLATHGAVRRTHARMESALEKTPLLPGGIASFNGKVAPLGALPLIPVILIVVAVAAVIAIAWYANTRVETDGQNLRDASRLASLTALAHEQLAAKGVIDPQIYASIVGLAEAEAKQGEMPTLVKIGIGMGVAGVLAAVTWNLIGPRRGGAY